MMRDVFDESGFPFLRTVPSKLPSRSNLHARERPYPDQHPLCHAQARGLVLRTAAFPRLHPLSLGNDWGVLETVCGGVV